MSNPVVGQDFEVNMVTSESLVGATVTLKYVKPDGVCVTGITPTNIDTGTGTITYELLSAATDIAGKWRFNADIIFSSGKKSTSNPATEVTFDPDIC